MRAGIRSPSLALTLDKQLIAWVPRTGLRNGTVKLAKSAGEPAPPRRRRGKADTHSLWPGDIYNYRAQCSWSQQVGATHLALLAMFS